MIRLIRVITVLGKLKDTRAYMNRDGYNVLADCGDWSPEKNDIWLETAVSRGDSFLIVTTKANGYFKKELEYLVYLMTTD